MRTDSRQSNYSRQSMSGLSSERGFSTSPSLSSIGTGIATRRSVVDIGGVAGWGRGTSRLNRTSSVRQRLDKQKIEAVYQRVPTSPMEVADGEELSWGQQVLDSSTFMNVMAIIILMNGAVIGLETDIRNFKHWDIVEGIFLAIFLGEVVFKMSVEGLLFFHPSEEDFLWNLFDIVIVGLGLFDLCATYLGISDTGGYATVFRMVRLLRVLRILRLLKVLKPLFLLAFGLIEACKAIIWVTLLMSFVLYILSIVLVKTVGEPPQSDPHFDFLAERFHTIPKAMITLFVLMSSPNLPEYQNQEGLLDQRPVFSLFLIMFICFGSFGMIAMLTGVINESMFENNELRKQERRYEHEAMRTTLGLRSAEIFESLPLDNTGSARVEDLNIIAGALSELLDQAGIQVATGDVVKFLELVDEDESGSIDLKEFVRAIERIAEGLSPLAIVEVQYHVNLCNKKLSGQMDTVVSIEQNIESQLTNFAGQMESIVGLEAKIENQVLQTFEEVHRILQAVCHGQNQHQNSIEEKIDAQLIRTSQEVHRILQVVDSAKAREESKIVETIESQMLHTVDEVDRILQVLTSDQHEHRAHLVEKIEAQSERTAEEVDKILRVVTSDQHERRFHLAERVEHHMLRTSEDIGRILQAVTGDRLEQQLNSGAKIEDRSLRTAQEVVSASQNEFHAHLEQKIESHMLRTSEEIDRILKAVTSNQNDAWTSHVEKVEAHLLRVAAEVERILFVLTSGESTVSTSSAGAKDWRNAASGAESPSEAKRYESMLLAAVSQQTEYVATAVQSAIDKRFSDLERHLAVKENSLMRSELAASSQAQDISASLHRAVSSQIQDISASLHKSLQEVDSKSKLDEIISFVQELNSKADAIESLRSDIARVMQEPKNAVVRVAQAQEATDENVDVLTSKVNNIEKEVDSVQTQLLTSIAELGGDIITSISDLLSQSMAKLKQEMVLQRIHLESRTPSRENTTPWSPPSGTPFSPPTTPLKPPKPGTDFASHGSSSQQRGDSQGDSRGGAGSSRS